MNSFNEKYVDIAIEFILDKKVPIHSISCIGLVRDLTIDNESKKRILTPIITQLIEEFEPIWLHVVCNTRVQTLYRDELLTFIAQSKYSLT